MDNKENVEHIDYHDVVKSSISIVLSCPSFCYNKEVLSIDKSTIDHIGKETITEYNTCYCCRYFFGFIRLDVARFGSLEGPVPL